MNKIVYNGLSQGLNQNSVLDNSRSITNVFFTSFDTTTYIPEILNYDNVVVNYAILDNNGFDLTDDSIIFADDTTNKQVGYLSYSHLDTNNIKMFFKFDKDTDLFDVLGINIKFHLNTPKAVTVKFYNNITNDKTQYNEIASKTVTEFNSTNVFVSLPTTSVTAFSVEFEDDEDNLVKLVSISVGKIFEFTEIENWNIYEEINLVSDDLAINTLDCNFFSEDGLIFIENSELEFYHYNEEKTDWDLYGVFFATGLTRNSEISYTLQAQDMIGRCDEIICKPPRFLGFNLSTQEILRLQDGLFSAWGYDYDTDLNDIFIGNLKKVDNEWIPITDEDIAIMEYDFCNSPKFRENSPFLIGNVSWRYNLMQLAFASYSVIDTRRTSKIYFKRLSKNDPIKISSNKIIGEANFIRNDVISSLGINVYAIDDVDTFSIDDNIEKEDNTFDYDGANGITLFNGTVVVGDTITCYGKDNPINPKSIKTVNCKLADDISTIRSHDYEGLQFQATGTTGESVNATVKVGTFPKVASDYPAITKNPSVSNDKNPIVYEDFSLMTNFENAEKVIKKIAPVVFAIGEVNAKIILNSSIVYDDNGFIRKYIMSGKTKYYLSVDLNEGENYGKYYLQPNEYMIDNKIVFQGYVYDVHDEKTADLSQLMVGDYVEIETAYSGTYNGYIRTMSLNGFDDLLADVQITVINPTYFDENLFSVDYEIGKK